MNNHLVDFHRFLLQLENISMRGKKIDDLIEENSFISHLN